MKLNQFDFKPNLVKLATTKTNLLLNLLLI